MSEPAVRVEDLGKEYRLGGRRDRYLTLRDRLDSLASMPLRAFRGRGERPQQDPPFWALKDVSFEVWPGEVVGCIGRNGAGKSTLLKVLSRITEPTEGAVDINGRVGSLLEVGTGFHPELTGRENVYLNGAILGMRRVEINQKFDEIVAFAEVEKFIDTPVKHYSSGMYMRLAFAVAAHLDPEILIIDEVLAVGDAKFQEKCLSKIGDVARCGRTVLFVSHNMTAIRQLCTRAVMLEAGRLVQAGDVNGCLDRYASAPSQSGRILDHSSHCNGAFEMREVEVNGSPCDELTLKSGERLLEIRLAGFAYAPVSFDIEVRMHDRYDNPVGFFAPAFDRGRTERFAPGPVNIVRTMQLPRMNRGTFYLNIFLAEPNVGYSVSIPNGLRLICEGTATATGQVFDCHRGSGWVLLEEASHPAVPVLE
jgi:lipopolysaccharide transport system ATP-binding protein